MYTSVKTYLSENLKMKNYDYLKENQAQWLMSLQHEMKIHIRGQESDVLDSGSNSNTDQLCDFGKAI